jgi:hypothetical protein
MMSIKGILTAIEAGGLVLKLAMGAGLVALVLVGYGLWHHKVYSEGWYAALASVARGDDKAVAKATEFRAAFKACRAASKSWDQTTGDCR